MEANNNSDFDIFKDPDGYKAFVYVLHCKGFFKIGYTSTNVKSRILNMVTGNPFEIDVVLVIGYKSAQGAKCAEKQLHGKYSKKRQKGEWFSLQWSDVRSLANVYKDLIVQDNINALDIEEKAFYISFSKRAGMVKNFTISASGLFQSPILRDIASIKDDNKQPLCKSDITWLLIKLQEYQKKIYDT